MAGFGAVNKGLSDDGDVEHECAAAAEEVSSEHVKLVVQSLKRQKDETHGILSRRKADAS